MVDVDFLRRCVKLRGTASDVERTFATQLIWTDGGDGRRRHCPARKPQFPRPLADIAHAVLGLDARPRGSTSCASCRARWWRWNLPLADRPALWYRYRRAWRRTMHRHHRAGGWLWSRRRRSPLARPCMCLSRPSTPLTSEAGIMLWRDRVC